MTNRKTNKKKYAMNFWNNPENNALKVLILVVLIAIAGFFAYTYMHNSALQNTGSVGMLPSRPVSAPAKLGATPAPAAPVRAPLGPTPPSALIPLVTTDYVVVTLATDEFHGTVDTTGRPPQTSHGFTYTKTIVPPAIGPGIAVGGALVPGAYTLTMYALPPCGGALYYFRAWAINSAGTGYGAPVPFHTASCTPPPTVTTSSATSFTTSTATLNGNITAVGTPPVTARGFEYGTTSGVYPFKTTDTGSFGTGTFNAVITGLSGPNTYYFRAYATNSGGTSYGTEFSFEFGSVGIH